MRVDDIGRTVKFCTDALGLEVSRRHTPTQTSSGHWIAFIDAPEGCEAEAIAGK